MVDATSLCESFNAELKELDSYRINNFSLANDIALSNSAVVFVLAVGKCHVSDSIRIALEGWSVDSILSLPGLVPGVFKSEAS